MMNEVAFLAVSAIVIGIMAIAMFCAGCKIIINCNKALKLIDEMRDCCKRIAEITKDYPKRSNQ